MAEYSTGEISVGPGVHAIRPLGAVGSPQIAHLEDKLGVELTRGLEVGKDVLEPSLNTFSVSLTQEPG